MYFVISINIFCETANTEKINTNNFFCKKNFQVKQTKMPLKNSINKQHLKKFRKMSSRITEEDVTNAKNRVNIMCTALVATFVVCWLPQHVWRLSRLIGIPIGEDNVSIWRCSNMFSLVKVLFLFIFSFLLYLFNKIVLNFIALCLRLKLRSNRG